MIIEVERWYNYSFFKCEVELEADLHSTVQKMHI